MKTPEEVLRQVALDEIQFDHGGGPGILNRATLEDLCRIYRGGTTGVSVATLEPAMKKLRGFYRAWFGFGGLNEFDAWAAQFFTFMNVVRFNSIYEVNTEIKRIYQRMSGGAPSPKRSRA